jgi:actin related protein 2/3 complex subunit 2
MLKRNVMAAPFEQAFAAQTQGQETEMMSLHYRDQEVIYIRAQPDRVTVIFSTVFTEETDRIIGKVFLQVFLFSAFLITFSGICRCSSPTLYPECSSGFV